jgi:electron transfer flavoprotein alpha subunit
LSLSSGGEAFGVLIADESSPSLDGELSALGLSCVFVYEHQAFSIFDETIYSEALLDIIEFLSPSAVLIGATPEGRALAPSAAVKLKTGVTADCTALRIDSVGILVQTRPAFGGNVMADIITPYARPQMATVRMGATLIPSQPINGKTRILRRDASRLKLFSGLAKSLLTALEPEEDESQKRVIVAVGAGVREKNDLEMFKRLANLAKAGFMCSRALVERGWMPQGKQIGLSGKAVSPDLLITFGISGSVQFQAGIKGAAKIASVNSDEGAPIFRIADAPLAGDIYEIAPLVIAALEAAASKRRS